MTMLVLVSAVAMLISPCAANPVRNLTLSDSLNSIIDIVEEYNENLTKSFYVEDVTHLVESGCGNNFFCKVHDILQKHPKNGNEEDIVRNLEIFIKKSDMNCKEVLKKVQPSEKEQPLPDLLGNLTKCIQRRNFMGNVAQAA
uniref:Interleukin 4/13A n=1 Tax=Oreochromis aureus TaxID=47969 RepID=A0AAZ1Y5Q2_OREAU